MPLHVPASLDRLLSLLAPAFSQPTFAVFRVLVAGFIGRVGEHTVTGMWQAVRLAGRVHHSRAHDFFARRRWDPDQLGLALLDFLVSVFVKPEAALRLAIDDTLFGRAGRQVWGAHYLHDGSQPAGQGKRTRWGNCWVQVGLVVELPCLGGRSVCLPVLLRLFRPRDETHPNRRSQPELARDMIELVLRRLPLRTVHLLFDGAYATKAWRGLPEHVTVTTRVRATAALYAPAPAPSGKRGRPALKGSGWRRWPSWQTRWRLRRSRSPVPTAASAPPTSPSAAACGTARCTPARSSCCWCARPTAATAMTSRSPLPTPTPAPRS